VSKSLVGLQEGEDGARYALLETVRQYAAERLAEAGERAAARDRHLTWCAALAEEAEPQLRGPEQRVWLAQLEREHDDMRAAMGWARESGEQLIGLCIAGALWRFWWVRGYISEGREWLERFLKGEQLVDGIETRAVRARALNGAGFLAQVQDDYERAAHLFAQSIALWRALGERMGIAGGLSNLGNLARERGEYAQAQRLLEESLALRRELGDRWGIAVSLNNLAEVYRHLQEGHRAASLYEESLALFRVLGDQRGEATVLSNLASLALQRDDLERAVRLHEESHALFEAMHDEHGQALALTGLARAVWRRGEYTRAASLYLSSSDIYQELGDGLGLLQCLEGLAAVGGATGQLGVAALLYGAAATLALKIGAPSSIVDGATRERYLAEARHLLGDAQAARAQSRGGALSPAAALEVAHVLAAAAPTEDVAHRVRGLPITPPVS
jgi:tetratricopeptide (TPR) repeat protein